MESIELTSEPDVLRRVFGRRRRPAGGLPRRREVVDTIADRHRRWMRAGRWAWVAGQLIGKGLWVTSLGTSSPAEANV